MSDISKRVEFPSKSVLLVGVTQTIKKKQKSGFFDMLLDTLGISLI